MISPMTPPNTKVACIRPSKGKKLPKLVKGAVYTVAEIIECSAGERYGVILHETSEAHVFRKEGFIGFRRNMRYTYSLNCFRRLDLPSVFREILAGKPISQDARDPEVAKPPKVKERAREPAK